MQHKITLNHTPPTESELNLLNTRDVGRFLTGAEEDYFLTRILILSTIYELGLYHYQQCMEKFFKSYLIQHKNKFKISGPKGHDLDLLRRLCSEFDYFFDDPDLVEGCRQITPFEVAGRYPNTKIRSYAYTTPHILFFLDEFVSEMRKRIDHTGISDVLSTLMSDGKFSPLDSEGLSKTMVEIFFRLNPFFKRIN